MEVNLRDFVIGMDQDIANFKRTAAEHAVTFVKPGTVIGLGHGSTAIWAVRRIADLVRSGKLPDIVAIPCSLTVERDARELGIPLATLEEHPVVDLTIDGADEVDPALNVIKGGGGALLREKIVGQATKRYIIVVDESKCSSTLGTLWPIPVEVIPFGLRAHTLYLESLGAAVTVRHAANGQVFQTDQGNLILDCRFGPIVDPSSIAYNLNAHAGIVGHGLFLGMATDLIAAGPEGIRHESRTS